jgi:hypothetical protein
LTLEDGVLLDTPDFVTGVADGEGIGQRVELSETAEVRFVETFQAREFAPETAAERVEGFAVAGQADGFRAAGKDDAPGQHCRRGKEDEGEAEDREGGLHAGGQHRVRLTG